MKTIDYDTEPRQQPRPVNVPGACQSIRRVLSRSGGMAFEAHDLTASGSAGSGAALVWFSTDFLPLTSHRFPSHRGVVEASVGTATKPVPNESKKHKT